MKHLDYKELFEKFVILYYNEKCKNKKAIEYIEDNNNYFEDGENWHNVLNVKRILKGENTKTFGDDIL